MFMNLRRTLNTRYFNLRARGILRTPPVCMSANSVFELVTQLCSRDVVMYLVALKSFCRFMPPRAVHVVGDRLTPHDTALLRQHVEGIDIRDINNVDTGACPRGGCWERLITIIDLATDAYIIQLDADTITFGVLDEVTACIERNAGFTLGTKMGREVVPVVKAAAAVRHLAKPDAHVQVLAEANFHKLEQAESLRYIRGNAAFAGFPAGRATRAAAESFSSQMEAVLGSTKWREWGSEQVASNFMIANSPGAVALPFERYRYFAPGANLEDAVFLHYVGSYRFAEGAYAKAATQVPHLYAARHHN